MRMSIICTSNGRKVVSSDLALSSIFFSFFLLRSRDRENVFDGTTCSQGSKHNQSNEERYDEDNMVDKNPQKCMSFVLVYGHLMGPLKRNELPT